MKEILGNHLTKFFVEMTAKNEDYKTDLMRTYKGERYEVHSVSDKLYEAMCDMTEEQFVELAGEDAWWRGSEGSSLGAPYERNIVNGHKLISWSKGYLRCEETRRAKKYESLSEYLCECIGASQPRNVCALAVDLAKYNNMTMGELFTKYEG